MRLLPWFDKSLSGFLFTLPEKGAFRDKARLCLCCVKTVNPNI
jgi:hypothetical protein